MKPQKFFILSFFALLLPITSYAADGIHTRIHHHYQSPRALGMGDAFVALANDYSAVLYNPAGLARREDSQLNLSIDAMATASFQKLMKEVEEVRNVDGTELEKQQAAVDFLNSQLGNYQMIRLGLLEAALVRPNWGLILIPADVTLEFSIHKQILPALNARVIADTTFAYGYGDDIKGVSGRLSWGLTGKFVNRGYYNQQISLATNTESDLIDRSDLVEGYTVDGDLGFLYSPDLPGEGFWSVWRLAKPTLGLVVRNIAETGFGKNMKFLNKEPTGTVAPEKLYRVLDVGAKFEYPSLWIFGGRGTIDFRDLGYPSLTVKKSLHLGFEFDWTMASWWRGHYRVGLNQGYFTGGLSMLFGVFNLDFVTFAEEVGSVDDPKESRQYMVRLNLDF